MGGVIVQATGVALAFAGLALFAGGAASSWVDGGGGGHGRGTTGSTSRGRHSFHSRFVHTHVKTQQTRLRRLQQRGAGGQALEQVGQRGGLRGRAHTQGHHHACGAGSGLSWSRWRCRCRCRLGHTHLLPVSVFTGDQAIANLVDIGAVVGPGLATGQRHGHFVVLHHGLAQHVHVRIGKLRAGGTGKALFQKRQAGFAAVEHARIGQDPYHIGRKTGHDGLGAHGLVTGFKAAHQSRHGRVSRRGWA